MPSVASLVRAAGGFMKHVDYFQHKEDNKEFLRSDLWEFTFINPPKIVFWPGEAIFQKRLVNISVGLDTSVNGFEKRVRGNFAIHQKTGQNTSGMLTLSFIDKEDQAITYFVDNWKQMIADRDTKFSTRKQDHFADCKLYLLNTPRLPVRELSFWNCCISDGAFDENGVAEDGGDRADVQLTMSFEHVSREPLNLR